MDTIAYALLIVCRYIGIELIQTIEHLLKSASYMSMVVYFFIQYAYTTFINKTGKFVIEKYLSQPDQNLRIH